MGCILNNFCFCFELRTGSLIMGCLNLVWNIIITVLLLIRIVEKSNATHKMSTNILIEVGLEMSDKLSEMARIAMCIALAIVIINLIFIILHLVGMHKNKRGYIKACLIYFSIFTGLNIILFIIFIAGTFETSIIITDLITLLLSIYNLVIVRSFYMKMDIDYKRQPIYNTA